jgi:hypothetical protein
MSRSLIQYGQLHDKRTAFFLCDIQEKFRPALSHFEQIVEAAKKLVWYCEHKLRLRHFIRFEVSTAINVKVTLSNLNISPQVGGNRSLLNICKFVLDCMASHTKSLIFGYLSAKGEWTIADFITTMRNLSKIWAHKVTIVYTYDVNFCSFAWISKCHTRNIL